MNEFMKLFRTGDKVLVRMYLLFLLCFVLVCHCKAYENPLPAGFTRLVEMTGTVPSQTSSQAQRRNAA